MFAYCLLNFYKLFYGKDCSCGNIDQPFMQHSQIILPDRKKNLVMLRFFLYQSTPLHRCRKQQSASPVSEEKRDTTMTPQELPW
jgi:hypothetical protein